MNRQNVWIDVVLLWVFTMGVWPLASPEHDAQSLLSVLDLALHAAAAVVLAARWKLARR